MPPSYARVEAAVNARIAASAYAVTLYYGTVRPTPTGAMPTTLPVSPLVATPNPTRPTEEVPLDRAESVTIPCLYTELSQLSESRRAKLSASLGGWTHDTRALIRVRAADVRRPQGGLWLEGVQYAELNARRYKVLGWTQTGGSGSLDGSYYVQLGAGN